MAEQQQDSPAAVLPNEPRDTAGLLVEQRLTMCCINSLFFTNQLKDNYKLDPLSPESMTANSGLVCGVRVQYSSPLPLVVESNFLETRGEDSLDQALTCECASHRSPFLLSSALPVRRNSLSV